MKILEIDVQGGNQNTTSSSASQSSPWVTVVGVRSRARPKGPLGPGSPWRLCGQQNLATVLSPDPEPAVKASVSSGSRAGSHIKTSAEATVRS